MTWRLAQSLVQLRDQINALSPNRSKISDGTIGNAEHAARHSDHNPDSHGIVHAMDITNDPEHGVDGWALAMALVNSHDQRIGYVISRGKIIAGHGGPNPWVAREYHGANRHDHHTHISVRGDNGDDPSRWALDLLVHDADAAKPPIEPANPLLTVGAKGKDVERMQMALIAAGLKIKPDMEFGPSTLSALKAYQRSHGLVPDGVCGPYTWERLLAA